MRDRALAIAGGAASALFFLSVAGGSFGAVIVALFAQLPLLLVGFALGRSCALVAAATAAAAVAAAIGPGHALGFAVKTELPALIAAMLALRSTAAPGGGTAWYPPGRILAWLTVAALAYVVYAVLPGGSALPLEATRAWLQESARGMDLPATPERIDALAGFVARYHAGMFGAAIVALVAVNAVIAQWMATRFGRNIRPTPAYAAIELPFWMEAIALVCLAMTILPGTAGLLGRNGLLVAVAPFFFVGLAVIHGVSRGWPGRRYALFGLYFLTIVVGWPAVLIVAVGFSESILGLRRRFPGPAPDREEE